MRMKLVLFSTLLVLAPAGVCRAADEEPAAINPFGSREKAREDAVPGYAELSDGTVYAGRLYLTRDARLMIYDESVQRQREIPLRVLRRIDCRIEKEWLEKEWRFKENANDEKVYTGRSYPARLYAYTVTLQDGRKIAGPLSGILYVDPYQGGETKRLLLHKRDKGPVGTDLKSLVYLQTVELGEEALKHGQLRADRQSQPADAPRKDRKRR